MTGVVQTSHGAVSGRRSTGGTTFLGIPYGADTGGANRFRPPQPVAPWEGVRGCVEYGPSCPQITVGEMTGQELTDDIEALAGVWNRERVTSEDCLVLNIWTPQGGADSAEDAQRPVLVWLHGGGFATGSASWPLYDFARLSSRGDVVVVSVNHRLGVLGFCDLSAHGDDVADSGNVGMLDIVAALGWVHDNIAAFGGDPGNVTVFGESGGGAKITALLAMPAARGLFQQVFVMSGALLHGVDPDAARDITRQLFDLLGVSDLAEFATVDVASLIAASLRLPRRGRVVPMVPFSPTLGSSLPAHPIDAIRNGSASGVQAVVGCTSHEMLSFVGTQELWSLDEAGLIVRVERDLGADAARVLAAYRALRPDESPASLYITIASDQTMRVAHIRLAEALEAGGGPAPFCYLFSWGYPGPDGVVRSGHGTDMAFCFDTVAAAPAFAGPHAAPLVDAMSGALLGLAGRRDPATAGVPAWPAYTRADRATMVIDVASHMVPDPFGPERGIWDDVGDAVLGIR